MDFEIWGSCSGIMEETALVMSKSLRKSRPFWDMTMDVKASSVAWTWRWVCVEMKNEAMRSMTMVGGAIEVSGQEKKR